MGVDAKGSEMVRAIVALALNLGMDVVAEGVETIEQVVELQTLGCDAPRASTSRAPSISGSGSPDRVSALARSRRSRLPC